MPRILLLFLLLHTSVHAQVFYGTIDKYPVVFELSEDEYNSWQARYYYTKVGVTINLKEPDGEGGDSLYCSADGECFSLHWADNTHLTGTWTKGDKTLKVSLGPADMTSVRCNYSTPALNGLNLFSYLKLGKIQFVKTKEEKWDAAIVLEWYKHPQTQIEFFRFKTGSKIKDLEKVNKELLRQHLKLIALYYDCVDVAPFGGEYTAGAKLHFLSGELMSFAISSYYYCGGAHPDDSEYGVTIDLRTLKEIKLEQLYWLSSDPPNPKDEYDQMRGYGSIWQNMLHKQYPDTYDAVKEEEELPQEESWDDCIYNESVWSNYHWYLTKNGLFIGTFFPRVIRTCDARDGSPTVPYKMLEKYRAKGNTYKL